jgi:hypothetical protein
VLPSLKKSLWVIGLAIGLAIAGIVIDNSLRCNAPPLTRDEALQRAANRLARYAKTFDVGNAPAVLLEEQKQSGSWIFTYHMAKCDVMVTVDRCHGDDIGGSSGCKPH